MIKAIAGCVLCFVGGLATGALVCKKHYQDKYEKLFQKELQSVKDSFASEKNSHVNELPKTAEECTELFKDSEAFRQYDEIVKAYKSKHGDVRPGDIDDDNLPDEQIEGQMSMEAIYRINAQAYEDFQGLFPQFEKCCIRHYGDGVFEFEDGGEVMDDVDVKYYFGNTLNNEPWDDYKDGQSCHVRNENMNSDYEIVHIREPYYD